MENDLEQSSRLTLDLRTSTETDVAGWRVSFMDIGTTMPVEASIFKHTYPGRTDQVHQVRADLGHVVKGCPFADDLILMASELCANAAVHSRSALPGGTFTVHAGVLQGDHAWLRVEDQGGPWTEKDPDADDEHGRGLAVVKALAGDGNWAIRAGDAPGTRAVWARLDWPPAQ
jgi:two-component sensor histidine kinase